MASNVGRSLKNSRASNVVKIATGSIRGTTFEYSDGHEASAFLGIPYAKPPVGELRFKKPVAPEPWTETRECTKFGPVCPHIPIVPGEQLNSSEDCLYLNVFAPERRNEKAAAPVLFWTHGGLFLIDSSNKVGDENICRWLCSKGVIVVTYNYRLGVFGFLTLGNKSLPGNYACFDWALALKWVRTNIGAFGGDPNRITVIGQSAGGCANDMMMLSPCTNKLFAQAINLAGNIHCPWYTFDQKSVRTTTIEWAKYKGAKLSAPDDETRTNADIEAFYREQSTESLTLGIQPDSNFTFAPKSTLPMCPTYDGDFFPKPLAELRRESPTKPIINSVTTCEGLFVSLDFLLNPKIGLVDAIAGGLHRWRPDIPKDACRKQTELVIGDKTDRTNIEHLRHAVNVNGDIMFNHGAVTTSNECAAHGSTVWNTIFSHYRQDTLGAMNAYVPFQDATHCMELPYIFGRSIVGEFEVTSADVPVINRYLAYLTAFIKTGDPNNDEYKLKWKPQTRDQPALGYFEFATNESNSGMRDDFTRGHLDQWQKFYAEHPRKFAILVQN